VTLEERNPGTNANLIANITLIDGYSNKHKIGKKSPKSYVGTFAKRNKKITETLRSHLIGNQDRFGITSNDYQAFIEQRSASIAAALNAKLSCGRSDSTIEGD
jgi:hypothetical protein